MFSTVWWVGPLLMTLSLVYCSAQHSNITSSHLAFPQDLSGAVSVAWSGKVTTLREWRFSRSEIWGPLCGTVWRGYGTGVSVSRGAGSAPQELRHQVDAREGG